MINTETNKAMTTTEIRKEIKKELGYNARQVSVKKDSYSMGSSLDFTIRDASVDYNKVKEFVTRFESVRRCEYTGEILSGGNTYIEVRVTDEVKNKWAEPHIEDVMIAASLIKAGVQSVDINDKYFLMSSGISNSFDLYKTDSDGMSGTRISNYYNCEDSCISIASKIARS